VVNADAHMSYVMVVNLMQGFNTVSGELKVEYVLLCVTLLIASW
jgi:hypothetical protein